MIFKDDEQLISFLRQHTGPSERIIKAREITKTLKALVTGKGFKDELIERIEKIEPLEKKIARAKYSRSIKDLFERLLRPIDNVYHSTGGSKVYNVTSDKDRTNLISQIASVRGGKTLENWLETFWMPQYHSDPSGVVFLEYTSKDDVVKVYPTYKSVGRIREYIPNGQHLEVILFEPTKVKIGAKTVDVFRVVDDETDYQVIRDGEQYTIVTDPSTLPSGLVTFDHPFGQVPALINSDIVDIDCYPVQRQSPIQPIDELTKEIARDQSIKTIYKFMNGFPIHWRYVQTCNTCVGTKKDGQGKGCKDCNGHGYYKSADVTDMVTLPLPKGDQQKIAPDIAGNISPDLETWSKYDEEQATMSELAEKTHWGATIKSEKIMTATEIVHDTQPIMNRLNKYADVAEEMERQLTEWIANAIIPQKKKDERVASVNYGRRYIIDPPDVILDKYNRAKESFDNNTILDRLHNEYITSKYKSDPLHLRIMLLKAKVEPYLHSSVEQINLVFSRVEAQRKIMFQEWWELLTSEQVMNSDADKLRADFDVWFTVAQTKLVTDKPEEDEQQRSS